MMTRTCILAEWTCILFFVVSIVHPITAADRGYGTQFGGQGNSRECTGQCKHRGQTYNGGERFSYEEGCIRYNCECQCNGWYDCPREKNEDICRNRNTDRTGLSGGRNCRECNVNGVLFPTNAPFNYNRGCTELNQCQCYCDGFWNCTQGRDICRNTRITQLSGGGSGSRSSYSSGGSSSSGSSYSSGASSSSSGGSFTSGGSSSSGGSTRRGGGAGSSFGGSDSRCRQCYISADRLENPNTYFKYRNGCAEWDSCFCNCEGRWNCDAKTYKKVCEDGGGGGIDLNGGSCLPCDVYGKIQMGNTDFVHRNGCHEWTNCHCSCGGSFYCSNTSYRWACDNICRECDVKGTKYPGNSEFSHTADCITYDPCQCFCNGSWSCPAETGRWTCTDRCRECEVGGNRYQGNSEFRHKEGCWEWDQCQCRCNGSWQCPKEHARWTCSQQCRDCVVNDQTYAANSPFTFERGDCYRFHCQCGCNGSYVCPPEKTENTCLIDPQTGCYPCDVHGKSYPGQSVFNHTDGCIQYNDCICNCNGFWECPGTKIADTCHPNTPGSCYQCDVNGNKVAGGSHFSLEDGDWRYDCECYCSGSWHCAAEAIYTGDSSLLVSGQCRDCYYLGRRHTSRTTFDSQWGCIKYRCQCNCDGRVECPVEQALSVCTSHSQYFQEFQIKTLSSVPAKYCSSCKINDYFLPGNSQFEYVDGCHRHMLRCYCNSGYRVAKKIIDSCVDGILTGRIQYSKTSAVFLSVSQQCDRKCIVNGVEHAARSSFDISLGCSTYRCQCACNGLPQCQAPVDTSCRVQIQIISSTRVTGGGSSSSHVSGGRVQSGGSTVVSGGSHSSGRVISGGSQSSGSIVTGGSRRVITGGTHSTAGGQSSTTRIVSGGSTVVSNGGSRVVNGGSRVVSGGSTVVSGGGGGSSSRVIERRIVSTGGGEHSVVRGGSTSVVVRGGSSSSSSSSPSSSSSSSSSSYNGCHFCVVEGKRYHGMALFDYRRGCVRYRCQCDCKGYAICRAVSINECYSSQSQCKSCYVENERYAPNSRFTFDKDCQRTSCRCECDGMATCVRTTIPGCTHHDGCKQCLYGGVTREPNTQFHIERTCEKTVCQCDCTGHVTCSSPIRTCAEPQTCGGCTVEGHYRAAKSQFTLTQGNWRMPCICECDNHYTCDRTKAEYIGDEPEQPDTCKPCRVDGQVHSSESKFYRELGCNRYRCQCFCDGTHQCASTGTNICPTPTTPAPVVEHQHCKPCTVSNREYASETTFSLERGCKRYECECYCSGRYGCRDSGVNTCHQHPTPTTPAPRPQPTCTKCHVQGKDYSPNTKFTIVYDECHVLHCKCSCDGSHDCDQEVTNVCGSRCSTCTHDGVTHRTNDRFKKVENCVEYECECHCDGTPRCSAQRRVCDPTPQCKVCTDQDGRQRRSGERYQRVENCVEYKCECGCDGNPQCSAHRRACDVTPQCSPCSAPDGQQYQPSTQFLYDKDCYRYTCDCACNGSYTCAPEMTRRICPEPTTAPPVCRQCVDPLGRRHPGSSRFSYDKDCLRFTCHCACDGNYNCPADHTRRICSHGDSQQQCQLCTDPNGRQHRAGPFLYDKDCHRYSCTCDCSGQYDCPSENTINYCNRGQGGSTHHSSGGSTHVSGSHSSGSSDSTSYVHGSSSASRYGYSTSHRYGNTGCFYCVAGGSNRTPNERFQFDDDCFRFSCVCACNGSWECPASQTQEICKTHSNSQVSSGSISHSHSQSSGSSSSSGSAHGSSSASRYGYSSSSRYGNTGCFYCVAGGSNRVPNERFQFDDDCFRFSCLCACNGSWECPASQTQEICKTHSNTHVSSGSIAHVQTRGSSSSSSSSSGSAHGSSSASRYGYSSSSRYGNTGCFYCVAGGSNRIPNERFQFDDDCFRFSCVCACNGSWDCPASQTQEICKTHSNTRVSSGSVSQGSGCRECSAHGKKYAGNSHFSYDRECYRYNCDCHCDGSWNCPAERTENLCTPERGHCRKCSVQGYDREPNSRFQFDKNCFRYDCDCYCNGSYNCPAERTREIPRCGSHQGTEPCLNCIVGGQSYEPYSDFSYSEGCLKHNCHCLCNGTHSCPASETVDMCSGGKNCTDCVVQGSSYRAGAKFQYIEGCAEYDCDCYCDGSYNCPPSRTVDICQDKPNPCTQCEYSGTKYPGNTDFVVKEKCSQIECFCDCQGRITCKNAINTCADRGDLG